MCGKAGIVADGHLGNLRCQGQYRSMEPGGDQEVQATQQLARVRLAAGITVAGSEDVVSLLDNLAR